MTGAQQQYPRGGRHWHINREITVGHLVSTLVLAGGLVSVYKDLDERIILTEQRVEQVQFLEESRSKQVNEFKERLDRRLDRIDDKLDKLIDRHLDTNNNGHKR